MAFLKHLRREWLKLAVLAALVVARSCGVIPIPAAASEISVPVVRVTTRAVSSAEILAITPAAPLQIVPAPGAGFGLVVVNCELSFFFNGVNYTNAGNGAMSLSYTSSGTGNACGSNFVGALVAVGANTFSTGTNNGSLGGFAPNLPINIAKSTAALTGGNGTMLVNVAYIVMPTQ